MPTIITSSDMVLPTPIFAMIVLSLILITAYLLYSYQRNVNSQVEAFYIAVLPYSLRLNFAQVRLENAKHQLHYLQTAGCRDLQEFEFMGQEKLTILQYGEQEAREPLLRLEQAEQYRLWWWTGAVQMPTLPATRRVMQREIDGDQEGYWVSVESD